MMKICFAALALLALVQPATADDFGHYAGTPITVTFLDGSSTERRMRLVNPLSYVDPAGLTWSVDAGFVTDGASIPRAFWSVVGGPFDGPYRDAALVHDKYCETKSRPWQAVHRMFYNAMRAAGVGETEAKTLYYAVRLGGPRWPPPGVSARGQGRTGNPPLPPPPPKVLTDADVKEFQEWIKSQSAVPSLEQLDAHATQRAQQ